jgi:hypothetical protein
VASKREARLLRQSEKHFQLRERHVRIARDRGYGDTRFQVLASKGSGSSEELQVTNGTETFWIYAAHTIKV